MTSTRPESANAGRSRRSGKTARRTSTVLGALQTTESMPPTRNSTVKRKAESVVSDEDSDYQWYVDSESEHTHTSTHTQNRIRVASFFTQPATRVGNARHKRKKETTQTTYEP